MSDGRTSLIAKYHWSSSTSRSVGGNAFRASGMKWRQNARPRPTKFFHMRGCDSWIPNDTASPRAEMLGRQALVVESVPRLVQHAEERVAEVIEVVASGHAGVARADAAA